MSYLDEVIKEVDKTHPHLGKLTAMSMVVTKAKKMLLIVAPRGCGKSAVTDLIGKNHSEVLMPDRISVAGMEGFADSLSNFDGVLIVDDLSRAQTDYAMMSTTASLAELCYGHRLASYLKGSTFEISNFNGAILANIQPVLLKVVVRHPLWESSMMDKSMRYYHMFRPLKPNPHPPDIKLKWGIDIDRVKPVVFKGKLIDKLSELGEVQWGLPRVREHMEGLLKACASLDDREVVTQADMTLLLKLLKPMAIEKLAIDKTDFEAKRYMNSNQLALLTEFLTYGQFTIQQLSRDYKLSVSQCYRIMSGFTKSWVVVAKNPTVYAPTDDLAKELKELGIK